MTETPSQFCVNVSKGFKPDINEPAFDLKNILHTPCEWEYISFRLFGVGFRLFCKPYDYDYYAKTMTYEIWHKNYVLTE